MYEHLRQTLRFESALFHVNFSIYEKLPFVKIAYITYVSKLKNKNIFTNTIDVLCKLYKEVTQRLSLLMRWY